MLLGQSHGCIETNNRKITGYMKNRLDDRFTQLGDQIIELGGIVPWDAGTIITMIDVAGTTAIFVIMFKYHCGVALVPVAILNLQTDITVVGKILSGKLVGRERRIIGLDEPVRVLYHPAGINTGVIRHHITGQPNATEAGTLPQICQRFPPPQIGGHFVVVQRIGRSNGLRITTNLFYPL